MRKILLIFFVFYILSIFFLRYIGYWNSPRDSDKISADILSDRNIVIGEVISFPYLKNNKIRFVLKANTINWHTINNIKIFVETYGRDIAFGDIILIRGRINSFDPQSRYSKYYIHKDIYYYIRDYTLNSCSYLKRGSFLRYIIQTFRKSVLNKILIINKGKAQAFLPAVLIGERSFFSNEDMELLREYALTHVISISGMHVGLIVLFLSFFFRNKKSLICLVLFILSVWFYAALTGFSPSCVRASIMVTLVLLGYFFEKKATVLEGLMATCFIMLLINPKLLFTVGFQFSFLATFGIIYYVPFLLNIVRTKNIPFKLKSLVFAVLSAQAALFPLVMVYFGSVNFMSILINFVFLPFLCIVMFSGIISIIVSYLAISLGKFIALINMFILDFLFKLMAFFYEIRLFKIENLQLSFLFIVGYYFCFLTLPVLRYIKKDEKFRNMYLAAVFIFTGLQCLCL